MNTLKIKPKSKEVTELKRQNKKLKAERNALKKKVASLMIKIDRLKNKKPRKVTQKIH